MIISVLKKIDIRFSEVDSMGVVWHGSFVKYLEDGRELFGVEHGLSYMGVASQGYFIPIVDMSISYKQSAKYGDKLLIKTEFINTEAAKIIFSYTIFRESDMMVLVKAKTVQVFTDSAGQLMLTNPPFYSNWKKSIGIFNS